MITRFEELKNLSNNPARNPDGVDACGRGRLLALGERLGCDFAGDAVFDGDGLHGGGRAQGEGSAVLGALRGRSGAVRGIADGRAVRTGDGHLGGLGERSSTADLRENGNGARQGSAAGSHSSPAQ